MDDLPIGEGGILKPLSVSMWKSIYDSSSSVSCTNFGCYHILGTGINKCCLLYFSFDEYVLSPSMLSALFCAFLSFMTSVGLKSLPLSDIKMAALVWLLGPL